MRYIVSNVGENVPCIAIAQAIVGNYSQSCCSSHVCALGVWYIA